jgi:hypothetical protein
LGKDKGFKVDRNGTVADGWGNNDGTLVGDAKLATGKVGNAMEFDGDGDAVNCGNDESLNFDTADPFTICAWIKCNPGRLEVLEPWELWGQGIVGKIDTNWHGYLLTVTGAGHPDEPYTLNGVLSHELGGNDINSSTPDDSMIFTGKLTTTRGRDRNPQQDRLDTHQHKPAWLLQCGRKFAPPRARISS